MTLTLTLDQVILHTVMHHSSASTYIPNFIEIEETSCRRTNVRTDVRMDKQTFETHFIRPTQRSRPNNTYDINQHKKTKNSFSCLLHHPAWKRRGIILVEWDVVVVAIVVERASNNSKMPMLIIGKCVKNDLKVVL